MLQFPSRSGESNVTYTISEAFVQSYQDRKGSRNSKPNHFQEKRLDTYRLSKEEAC